MRGGYLANTQSLCGEPTVSTVEFTGQNGWLWEAELIELLAGYYHLAEPEMERGRRLLGSYPSASKKSSGSGASKLIWIPSVAGN